MTTPERHRLDEELGATPDPHDVDPDQAREAALDRLTTMGPVEVEVQLPDEATE